MSQNEIIGFVRKLLSESRAQIDDGNIKLPKSKLDFQKDIDGQIRHLMQQNDPAALALIFETYGPNIYGILLQILKSEEEAKTTIPIVFEEIWKRKGKLELRDRPLLPWLVGFTIRCSVEKLGVSNPNLYSFLY